MIEIVKIWKMEKLKKINRLTLWLMSIFFVEISSQQIYENSSNICQRCRCETSAEQFVLDCSDREMHHALSNWPKHDNKTLRASFSYNIITTLEPLPATEAAVMVKLDHCNIKYLSPGLFENMKNVTFVDLSYNQLTNEELAAEKFKGPFNNNECEPIELRYLDLSYNLIHSLSQYLFEHTPRLVHLNLEGNSLHVIDVQTEKAFSSVPNLQYLNLANNGLLDLTIDSLENLTKLREIDLSNNYFGSIPDYALAMATNLQVLKMDGNPIASLSSDSFEDLPSLTELSLNNLTYLDIIPKGLFVPLKRLRKLEICRNKNLQHIEVGAFDPNQTLNELYLEDNKLWEIFYELLDWYKLDVFKFKGNGLRCTCDLYEIIQKLKPANKMDKNGPLCIGDFETSHQVFYLDGELCDDDFVQHFGFKSSIERKLSFARIALITISLVAITSSFIIVGVCYTKHKKYGLDHYSFMKSSTVLYNPLVTSLPREI